MEKEYVTKINELLNAMDMIEKDISILVEIIKHNYVEAATNMPAGKNYYLSGIQLGSVVKPYHLTRNGIEIHGEKVIPIPDFIDSVIKFANYPKRKIMVLKELAEYLQKMDESDPLGSDDTGAGPQP